MDRHTKSTMIYLSKILIPIIIVMGLFLGGINAGIITFEPPEETEGGKEVSATILIDFGDGTSYSTVLTLENATGLDVLLELEKQGVIGVGTTYWESFGGYSVDSITYNNITYKGDTGRYWAFYVNGEASMKGADKIYVHDNDVTEW
ncbi:MAG: DUF4430 domain-containing protein, partial [Candidatus Thermoplasmatota archaeon]|nr:DUF4430 domain-containing protein [Candidatus Thermoplasmatota archaeon]